MKIINPAIVLLDIHGEIMIKKTKLRRWKEYIEGLFQDHRVNYTQTEEVNIKVVFTYWCSNKCNKSYKK